MVRTLKQRPTNHSHLVQSVPGLSFLPSRPMTEQGVKSQNHIQEGVLLELPHSRSRTLRIHLSKRSYLAFHPRTTVGDIGRVIVANAEHDLMATIQ